MPAFNRSSKSGIRPHFAAAGSVEERVARREKIFAYYIKLKLRGKSTVVGVVLCVTDGLRLLQSALG
jgi:hypothetical protein